MTSEGWRRLQEIGIRQGIVATAYEQNEEVRAQQFARLHQFLQYHLWAGSCANVTCPSAMQDGAARLLSKTLAGNDLSDVERQVFQTAYDHLTSRDPEQCWTSGQWMTERSGGSDVRGTETVATWVGEAASGLTDIDGNPLGPWRIDGFKWFSSATDSQMAILLAKTEDGQISTFIAPTRRARRLVLGLGASVELNGIQIQRLKSKMGTKPLPTAELVLSDMRAWRLGLPGQGTKEISTILNITRIHTGMTALGYWGRALAISRAYAKVRNVAGGKRLTDMESHVKNMADNAVKYRARMALGFFAASMMGRVEHPAEPTGGATTLQPEQRTAENLFRLLTPLVKAVCSKDCIAGIQECMESLGGLGYLESEDQEMNIARLFRDANVLPIWEGTTEVIGSDIVRVLKPSPSNRSNQQNDLRVREAIGQWLEGETETKQFTIRVKDAKTTPPPPQPAADPPAITALASWIANALCNWQRQPAIPHAESFVATIGGATRSLFDRIRMSSADELRYNDRPVMWRLAWLICSVLLVEDAKRDNDEVTWEVARRWIFEYDHGNQAFSADFDGNWKERAEWDRKIVFGEEQRQEAVDQGPKRAKL